MLLSLLTFPPCLLSLDIEYRWRGQPAFPFHRFTRLVLLQQQLLIEAVDVLNPQYVRISKARRVKLRPIKYGELPNVRGAAARWG